jgi:HEAT repeat protein
LIGVGIVLILGVFVYWDNKADHKFTARLSIEPTYNGQTLNFWLQHWYPLWGPQHLEVEPAIRTMGTNAVPYLVKWITEPARTTTDYDKLSRVLKGFEILGPVASPAIPELVNNISRNGNFVSCALGYIGPSAIPALTNKLLDTISVANPPAKRQSLFYSNGHPRPELYVQRNILEALSFYGTNAQPAVSALIAYIQSPNAREAWEAVGVLAAAGHNQPEMVFPVLFQTFSNSPGNLKASVADALSTFGTNAVSAIPLLLSGQNDHDANARAHISVAIKKIAPATPHALDVVIYNLEYGNDCQQVLYILGTLGTNAIDALPALIKCLSHPNVQIRIDTTRTLKEIGVDSDAAIAALGLNLSSTNEFLVEETEEVLCMFAGHSDFAFFTLAKKAGYERYRSQAAFLLGFAMQTNTPSLLKGLDSPDPQVRLGTLEVFSQFLYPSARPHLVPEAVPKLKELSANDPDPHVRERAGDMLYYHSQ